jgi:hypothetical protein
MTRFSFVTALIAISLCLFINAFEAVKRCLCSAMRCVRSAGQANLWYIRTSLQHSSKQPEFALLMVYILLAPEQCAQVKFDVMPALRGC